MTTHILKTYAEYWDAVERGEKTYEVRKNDRFFQTGDLVELVRLRPKMFSPLEYEKDPAKAALRFRIGAILQGGQFGIEPGYCVFSLLPTGDGK